MKKLVCLCLMCALLLPCLAMAENVVNVFNWEEYISQDAIDLFQQETGITVNYMRFTTNEDMMSKVENSPGSFDVIFPSDYLVQRMTGKGLLVELDYSQIPNFQYLKASVKNPSYDPNNAHSVPYMGGTLGILYDPAKVDEADVHTWGVLWNEKYRGQVLMMDSLRDAMGIALKYRGYSMNSTDPRELKEAGDLLLKMKTSGMVKSYGLDDFKDKMVAGEAAMAIVYSGDAQYAVEKRPDLKYVIPDEGSNIWTDCMVIPKDAKNLENAYRFIDFMCRPDVAIMNTEAIGYITSNEKAVEEMGEEYASLYILNPTEEEIARLECFNDLDSTMLRIYEGLWDRVKSE